MSAPKGRVSGLALGLTVLGGVAVFFALLFAFGPERQDASQSPDTVSHPPGLAAMLEDPATRKALEALRNTAPATYAQLQSASAIAIADGATVDELSNLVLQALFAQFRTQAVSIKSAGGDDFQDILSGLSTGLQQLKATQSEWCEGERIAIFLAQNDDDLVPRLLEEFPYASPQYDWAMDWMVTVLVAAKQGQDRPQRHFRPGPRDETILQREGLALGSEQWTLALQIAAFANSEGVSYATMQDAISGMDVCELGIAIEAVSRRLPVDVRGRIWADILPEVMMGNTPYVIWRVTDYFFIG